MNFVAGPNVRTLMNILMENFEFELSALWGSNCTQWTIIIDVDAVFYNIFVYIIERAKISEDRVENCSCCSGD